MTTTTKLDPATLPTPSRAQINAENGCAVCAHIVEHHWIGVIAGGKGSHCMDCCRTWTSKAEGHCAGCCAHFATTRAFDAHFARDGSHLDPATTTRRDGQPRFVARNRPGGVTWALAFYGSIPTGFGRRSSAGADSDD